MDQCSRSSAYEIWDAMVLVISIMKKINCIGAMIILHPCWTPSLVFTHFEISSFTSDLTFLSVRYEGM